MNKPSCAISVLRAVCWQADYPILRCASSVQTWVWIEDKRLPGKRDTNGKV